MFKWHFVSFICFCKAYKVLFSQLFVRVYFFSFGEKIAENSNNEYASQVSRLVKNMELIKLKKNSDKFMSYAVFWTPRSGRTAERMSSRPI